MPTVLLCTLLGMPVEGLPDDAAQPLSIDADSVTYDDDPDGIIELLGNVKLQQGTLHITAERISATKRDDKLNRVLATGADDEPVRFQQQVDAEEPPARGRAQTIDYSIEQERAKLTGDAFLAVGQREYNGGTIVWDMKENRVDCQAGCQFTEHPPKPVD